MRLIKLLSVLLLCTMLLNLTSCDSDKRKNEGGDDTVQENGEPETQKITYVYSITQKRLHLPECQHVKNISQDLRAEYSGDISLLFAKGYTICKDCLFVNSNEDENDEASIPDADEVPYDEATYVINRSSLKIHKKECDYIKTISDKNLKYTCLSYEELIEINHVPCGHCMEDEYLEYKKTHPN